VFPRTPVQAGKELVMFDTIALGLAAEIIEPVNAHRIHAFDLEGCTKHQLIRMVLDLADEHAHDIEAKKTSKSSSNSTKNAQKRIVSKLISSSIKRIK
jgi:hypothetical protein